MGKKRTVAEKTDPDCLSPTSGTGGLVQSGVVLNC